LVTERQIAHWRRSGLLRAGPTELAQARTIAALRRAGVSLTRIRAAAERLRAGWDGDSSCEPLSDGSLLGDAGAGRIAVLAGEVFIRHPDGAWEGDRQPGQLILHGVLPLLDDPSPLPPPGPPRVRRRRDIAVVDDREAILRFVAREDAADEPRGVTGASRGLPARDRQGD
jgi:hypothetical protein